MTDLRSELGRVQDAYGRLTPWTLLESARDPESPLHHRFEWDDTVAAENWRREQAAEIIRSYRVVYARGEGGPRSVRGYIAIRPENDAGKREYLPVEEVMVNPLMRKLVLRDLERDLTSLKDKYGHLKEFTDLLLKHAAAA